MKDTKSALITMTVFIIMFLGTCLMGVVHDNGTSHSAQKLEAASFDLRPDGNHLLTSGVKDVRVNHQFILTEQSGIYVLTILSDIVTLNNIDGLSVDCFGEERMDGISILSGGGMTVYQSEIRGGTTVQAEHGPSARSGSGFVAEFLGNGSGDNNACSRFCFKMFDSDCNLKIKMLLQYGSEEINSSITQDINIRIVA